MEIFPDWSKYEAAVRVYLYNFWPTVNWTLNLFFFSVINYVLVVTPKWVIVIKTHSNSLKYQHNCPTQQWSYLSRKTNALIRSRLCIVLPAIH